LLLSDLAEDLVYSSSTLKRDAEAENNKHKIAYQTEKMLFLKAS